jgi:hypothetical protein
MSIVVISLSLGDTEMISGANVFPGIQRRTNVRVLLIKTLILMKLSHLANRSLSLHQKIEQTVVREKDVLMMKQQAGALI